MAKKYHIFRTDKDEFTKVEEENPIAIVEDVKTFVDNDVKNFKKYKYKIKEEENGQLGDFSAEQVAVPTTKPPAPTNLTATYIDTEKTLVKLEWTGIDYPYGKKKYNIYRDGTKIDSVSGTSYVDKITAGEFHIWYVTAQVEIEIG